MLLSKNDYKKTLEALRNPCRGQSRVLSLLRLHPVISQKELANLLGVRAQSLGELLVKLERNGYISRIQSDTDRRVKNVVLTPEGIKAANRLEQSQLDRIEFLNRLNLEEQEQLNDFMDRLIEGLEEEVGDGYESEEHMKHGKCPYPHQVRHQRGNIHHGPANGNDNIDS